MSRTYRRLNAFDKLARVEAPGVGWSPLQKAKRYQDVRIDKKSKKVHQLFHSDKWLDDVMIHHSYKRKLTRVTRSYDKSRWNILSHKGDEELFVLSKKEQSQHWYFDYKYFY